MASAIDATKPVAGSPTTQSVRDNFATAASEITALQAAPNQTITLSGDIAGSGTAAITTTLPNVNANVGTFQGITVNAKGQVTAAANQSYVTGGPYLATAGGTLTGNIAHTNTGSTYNMSGSGTPLTLHATGAFDVLMQWDNPSRTWKIGCIGSTSNPFWIFDGTAGATRVSVDTAGVTYNTSGAWATISDPSVKEDVQSYRRGLDAILSLNPVVYRRKAGTPFAAENEPSEPLIGLMADEVKPYIPEIVGSTTGTVAGEEVALDTLSPGDLVYVLINAVKELQAEIDALKAGSA